MVREFEAFEMLDDYATRGRGEVTISNERALVCVRIVQGAVIFRGQGETLLAAIRSALDDGWDPLG